MSITAAMVSELRKKTGAGMMDCKKALTETAGNMDDAVDFLRKKGLSAAAKKSGRVAAEGMVVAASEGSIGALVEVNAETDFVAKNDAFKAFAAGIAQVVLAAPGSDDVEALKALPYPETGRTVAEELTHQIATIGENMDIRRFERIDAGQGVVSSYVHGAGKIGVLVELQTESTDGRVAELGRQIAMHVAAAAPQYLTRDDVPSVVVDKEKEIMRVKALDSGKPENIVEKIITGQINKYFGEVCLLEQAFVIDPDQKVGKIVEALAKELGTEIKLNSYARFQLGEGIEKKEGDFAAEVAALSK
ncbi:MAG: elongation factor Ts [Deltaproteobacteria bacterium]|nr:elongation factor Ts [Deltaproteobacteria bacterium]